MVRECGVNFVVRKQAKALAGVAALLFGAFLFAGPALAQLPDPCPTGQLGMGGGVDIVINKRCNVGSGNYNYGKVNIIAGGSLVFQELIPNVKIDFWASSILVENGGGLYAGADPQPHTTTPPFGSMGGVLTIHLYGMDQGVGGKGIICQSQLSGKGAPCGIPDAVWTSKGASKVSLPGGVSDYFYQYSALPIDNGQVGDQVGFFGYKVLAVSYGGTLNLFGKKGATYGSLQSNKQTGTSWVRLAGTILGSFSATGATSLTVASPVDWQAGDHIVVTTTDYLANHSEELIICSVSGSTIDFDAAINSATPCTTPTGVQWTHNGDTYSLSRLPSRLNITKTAAETRAAVGLLTRSIRIVSEGDTYGDCFPPSVMDLNNGCLVNDSRTNYFFGGHTIARQGFTSFQVQGVEFRQLGQGGRLGHYPIHFHLARQTPPNTFVKDSSINESMTRWITIHGTQGVTLARNVGYLSIGHGFYLEDAVETDNKFYSNLGIFARAAVTNAQNPRNVPGILASPNDTPGSIIYGSDKSTPSVFWITNGWNDFQGNMAAGAGFCGVCYWEVPASIGGPSLRQTWESYASEQTSTRTGTSPLMNFDGNYCTSAMTAFNDVGYTIDCPGVGSTLPAVPVINPNAPNSTAAPPECGPGGTNPNWPLCPGDYYPNVDNGQLFQATQCPATGPCSDTTAIICQPANETNCLPNIINDFTTSFNYSQFNFAALWLRTRWHLVSNSFISDVQNAGLTFLSGGDYTHSSAIPGLWELAFKTVFAGQTQPADMNHAFASVLSPYSAGSGTDLTCQNVLLPFVGCIDLANSFALTFSNFGVAEHMFNIYDGPASEDSNAYLDIKKTDLGTSSTQSVYVNQVGIPKVVQVDPNTPNIPVGDCYIPNAAIGWKQPNGFYYPPTFHSTNLFFNNVDIRHLVIVPQFNDDTYTTNSSQVMTRYCATNQNGAMFNNFTAIDRQTELTDDDGSLTGYVKTISVNEDPFFFSPVDGIQCQSDGATPEGGTARTSPYDYVTTVVYPDSAKQGNGVFPPNCGDANWSGVCTNPQCFGVPLYRLYQTGPERAASSPPGFIRMAATAICQRETMTVNHGLYYVDLTASQTTQNNFGSSINVFTGGKTYDFFLLFAKSTTVQTYQMFVGTGLTTMPAVKPIRVNIGNAPFIISTDTVKTGLTPPPAYNSSTGILTVTLNLSAYANDITSAATALCQPRLFCQPTGHGGCGGKAGGLGNLTQAERDATCSHAGEDVDCPTGGCVGFSVTLPGTFTAMDQTTMMGIPSTLAMCFPKDTNWNVTPVAAPSVAGACVGKNAPINSNFCVTPLGRLPRTGR